MFAPVPRRSPSNVGAFRMPGGRPCVISGRGAPLSMQKIPAEAGLEFCHARRGVCPPTPILKPTPMRRRPATRHCRGPLVRKTRRPLPPLPPPAPISARLAAAAPATGFPYASHAPPAGSADVGKADAVRLSWEANGHSHLWAAQLEAGRRAIASAGAFIRAHL
jgi:hypothetical protein